MGTAVESATSINDALYRAGVLSRRLPPVGGIESVADHAFNTVQAARHEICPVVDFAEIEVKDNLVEVHDMADLHYAHLATDLGLINDWFGNALAREHILLGLEGDIVGWLTAKYLHSVASQTVFDGDEQLMIMREKLRRLSEQNKIGWAVEGHVAHEGWARAVATIRPIRIILDGLEYRGKPIPIIRNGGTVSLRFPDGRREARVVAHISGKKSTHLNPLAGQRDALDTYPLNSLSVNPRTAVAAHYHQPAVAVEVVRNKITGDDSERVLIATGTAQGVNPGLPPDEFVTSIGIRPSWKNGQKTSTHYVQMRGERDTTERLAYPSLGNGRRDAMLVAVFEMYERMLRTGSVDELRDLVLHARRANEQGVSVKSISEESRTGHNWGRDGKKRDTPLWELLALEVSASLPVLELLVGNTRHGSSSLRREEVLAIINHVVQNPFALMLATGNWVDKDVPRRIDRRSILRRMTHDLGGLVANGKLIAFMFSSVFRDDSWETKVGGRDGDEPFEPSEWLYCHSKIKGVPLYPNDAIISMRFYKPDRQGRPIKDSSNKSLTLVQDHLMWSGSVYNPFLGLTRARDRARLDIDLVVGGHMPGVGWLMTPEGVCVAPAWHAQWDARGKANRIDAPGKVQGVIWDDGECYPVSGLQTATEMHTAFLVTRGLLDLGRYSTTMNRLRKKSRGCVA